MEEGAKFSYSPAPVRRVKAMQFGVLDPDFIVSPRGPGCNWQKRPAALGAAGEGAAWGELQLPA